jgi:hypothetical protein
MKKLLAGVYLAVLLAGTASVAGAQGEGRGPRGGDAAAPVSLDQKLKGLEKKDGFIPMYWDARAGKVYLEVTKFDSEFMYVYQTSGSAGTAGIQRGAITRPQIVTFRRVGPKVMLVAKNFLWRTGSDDPYQKLALQQSFPESVIWGFSVAAEDGPQHVLLDATEFFMHDAPGFAERLSGYRLDASRSAIVPENVKNFPLNLVVETMLTFTNEGGGGGRGGGGGAAATVAAPGGMRANIRLNEVTPDARAVSLRERQILMALPAPGYKPRIWDQRSGQSGTVGFRDWTKPLGEPVETRYMIRHRLEKKDPTAAVSEVKEPIVYYIDRGAPDSVRQALLEGGRWWNAAFEAAGFKNAYKVEILPEGADPLDIRYNMVMWVHEAERGFSNGANIVDPRTGEVIKSEVTLTSGREHQDYLITEALLSPYKKDGKPEPQQNEMVMNRMRQLAAHEIGHTLGLAHNFAASSFGAGNGTVDDYPFPQIQVDKNGHLDLTHAYNNGMGAWDKLVIAFTYTEFPPSTTPEQEKAGLEKIIQDGIKHGIYFQTEEGNASASPHATQWDNGPDGADELDRLMKIREIALKNFSEAAIKPGEPMASLEDVLVPVYLLHRYQVGAAAQEVGGQDYRYAERGDGQMVTKIVAGDEQRKALTAVLKTLDPQVLTLPETLLEKFPPRPPDGGRTQESWGSFNGPSFDAEAPALTAATVTLDALLEPGKASRLVEFHARDESNPGLKEVLDSLLKATWYAPAPKGLAGLTKMTVDGVVLEKLTALSTSNTSPIAKAVVRGELAELRKWIGKQSETADGDWKLFYAAQMEAAGAARGGAGAGAGAAAAAPAGGRNAGPTPGTVPNGPPI